MSTVQSNRRRAVTAERIPYFAVLRHTMGAHEGSTIRYHMGEELPVLIAAETGVPFVAARRWLLFLRPGGLSVDYLASMVGALGWLYEACARHPRLGFDLDQRLFAGGQVSPGEITHALKYMERHGDVSVVGGIAPGPGGGVRVALRSARQYNRIRSVWRDFLIWTLTPSNYRWCQASLERPAEIVERDARRRDWEEYFTKGEGRALPAPKPRHRSGLTRMELAAIEAVVCPDDRGNWPTTFSKATRLRNYLMYLVARWGGLRIGENLKLYASDVPPPPQGVSVEDPRIARHYREWEWPDWVWEEMRFDPDWEFDGLNVQRRPDDILESHPQYGRRGKKPRVKTAERVVTVGDDLGWALRAYVALPPPFGRSAPEIETPYLFVAQGRDGVWRPIAVQTVMRIIKQIGAAATKWMAENHPDRRHTLDQLTWHRLRHTRAWELLPEYLDDDDLGLDQFCDFFGWASILSARPYVRRLMKKRGSEKVRVANRRIEEEATRRRAARRGESADA